MIAFHEQHLIMRRFRASIGFCSGLPASLPETYR